MDDSWFGKLSQRTIELQQQEEADAADFNDLYHYLRGENRVSRDGHSFNKVDGETTSATYAFVGCDLFTLTVKDRAFMLHPAGANETETFTDRDVALERMVDLAARGVREHTKREQEGHEGREDYTSWENRPSLGKDRWMG